MPEGERTTACDDIAVIQARLWVCVNVKAPLPPASLCTTCVRTVDERESSVGKAVSLRITLWGQKIPLDQRKRGVQSDPRTGQRTPTGTRGTVPHDEAASNGSHDERRANRVHEAKAGTVGEWS